MGRVESGWMEIPAWTDQGRSGRICAILELGSNQFNLHSDGLGRVADWFSF